MSPILLDRTGDADPPDGHLVVTTEREFLAVAGVKPRLLVRGATLCDWAEQFYAGRKVTIHEAESPLGYLRDLCPELSIEQADALLQRIRPALRNLARPWRISALLQLLYPNALWDESPSPAHAASWLLWLHQTEPIASDAPLRSALARQWQQLATGLESSLYEITEPTGATAALLAWLDVDEANPYATLRPFPGEVPQSLIDIAKVRWKKALIQSKGEVLARLMVRPLVKPLRQTLVQVAYDYFVKQPQYLTSALFAKLAPALTSVQQDRLRKLLPPPRPSELPSMVTGVMQWFRDEYIPYRLWQTAYGDEAAAAHIRTLLHSFAGWYLEQYRSALAGGPLSQFLAYKRMAALHKQQDSSVTLAVVLDGLQIADAEQLVRALEEATDRLTFVDRDLAFAPLPTVTEFCKDSLFRGVPPVYIPNVPPLGVIESNQAFPLQTLAEAQPGDVVFWRVMEPDATYHDKNSAAKLNIDVQSALDGVASKLAEIVESLDSQRTLRIIITTDHGRLLGRATRTLPVPSQMQSHGRAAWGDATMNFPASGYILEEHLAYLHRSSFALPKDAVVAITEQAFLTESGHAGAEVCPHGGLSPEEVIIPWFIALRDFSMPALEVVISGHGRAEAQGQLKILFTNTGAIPAICTGVTLEFAQRDPLTVDMQTTCAANDQTDMTLEVKNWPTVKASTTARATVEIVLPNGQRYRLRASEVTLSSEEMYTRSDILEGLDL